MQRSDVLVVGALAFLIFLAATWRFALCHRRMMHNHHEASWVWFDRHHAALLDQQRQQVEILEEIADNVIYLADYRAKKG